MSTTVSIGLQYIKFTYAAHPSLVCMQAAFYITVNCDRPEHLLYAPEQWFSNRGTVSASPKLLKGLTDTAFQCTASEKLLPSRRQHRNYHQHHGVIGLL